MTVVDDFAMSPLEVINAVLKIIAVVNEWQSHFRSAGATEVDITEIAASIDAPDLLARRQSFSAEAYASGSKPRRKRSSGAKAFR
jgi:serine/threonine-protein kinase HipA